MDPLRDEKYSGRGPQGRLDAIYRLPVDTNSLNDWERRRHVDLVDLDDLALRVEEAAILRRLGYDDGLDRGWLGERLDAIDLERTRRRSPAAPAPSAPPAANVRPGSANGHPISTRRPGAVVFVGGKAGR